MTTKYAHLSPSHQQAAMLNTERQSITMGARVGASSIQSEQGSQKSLN